MDFNTIISLFALILSVLNTIWLIINFFLSKAPILEFKFVEPGTPNELKFYLRNIGVIKGKLTELSFRDSITEMKIRGLFYKDQQ